MNLFKRIPKINWRKPTSTQIIIGIVGIILILAILRFLIDLASTLLPIALIAIVVYVAFRYFTVDHDQTHSIANIKASDVHSSETQTQANDKTPSMRVSDKINSKTGLREPDMERLLAEEERAQQKKSDAESIRSQIEERKKRLMND